MAVDLNRFMGNPQKFKTAFEHIKSVVAVKNNDRPRPFTSFNPSEKGMCSEKVGDYVLSVRNIFKQIQILEDWLSPDYKHILPNVLSKEIEAYTKERGISSYTTSESNLNRGAWGFTQGVVISMNEAFRAQVGITQARWNAKYNQEFKNENSELLLALKTSSKVWAVFPEATPCPHYQNQLDPYWTDIRLYSLGVDSLVEAFREHERNNGHEKPYELQVVGTALVYTAKHIELIFEISKVEKVYPSE